MSRARESCGGFQKPLGLSVNKLALLHVPATRIGEIVHERRRFTAETATLGAVLRRTRSSG
jgi:plasmid maintenance system antidote protein VapI